MKKLFSLIAAVLFAGSMMAEGLLFEQTYPGTPSTKTNSYSKSFTLTTGDYTLTYANINNGSNNDAWTEVRAGSKNGASIATITTGAIAESVSKVVIDFTQVNASKTNSLSLKIASAATFADATVVNATIAMGEVAFEIAEPAENMFYQIVIDMAQGSANGFNRWDKIQFISPDGGTPIIPVEYDTLTVAEARLIADTLADKATSKEKYYVEGYAVHVADYSADYKNQDFFMVDDAAAPDSLFQAYRATPTKDGKPYPVLAGDKVRVFGNLKKFGTQLEIVNGAVSFIEEVDGDRTLPDPTPVKVDTITVARALAIGDSIGQGKTSSGQYVIEGYVTALTNNSGTPNADGGWAQYGNQCMWVADTFNEEAITKETAFFIYQGVATEQVTKGAKIRVTCAIKNYNGMIETAASKGAITILSKGEDPEPPAAPDTITVARALAIGDSIGQGKTTSEMYVVDGYVIDAEAFHQTNKNQTWTMADEADAASATFKAYRCVPMNGTDTLKVLKGDKVRICGAIQNYNGTIEISYVKAEFLSMVEGDHSYADKPQEKVDTISVARALEIGEALAAGKSSDSIYVIAGFVSKIITAYDTASKNESFWMIDTIGGRAASNAEGAFEVYRGKMDTIAEQDAMVYVTAKIYKYQPSSGNPVIETANSPIPEVHVAVAGHAEIIDTITVARALEIGQALADGKVSGDKYCITGYVSAIEEMYSSYGNETFWITDEKGQRTADKTQAFEVYRGKPNTAAEIGFDAKIQITCYIKNFSGTIENDGTNIPFEVLEQGSPIQIDTISVAQAIEETGKLPTGEKSPGFYAVKGYIASTSVDSKQKISFYLCDDITEPNTDFQCYRPNFDKADSAKVAAGSYVLVVGKLDNNSHGKQMAQGAAVTFLEAPKIDTLHVTVAQAEEVIAELAEDEVTKAFYIVTGYVVNPQEVEDEIQSFFLSDDAQATQASFYVEGLEVEEALIAGQSVEILGKLKKYKNPFAETIQSRLVNGQILSIDGKQQGIEQIVLTEKAKKVVVDGHVYIIRDNKLFNLQGARVR